jgi:CelD/BcsL family acetyltransferase involved in cellulose biosynthesis
MLQQDSYFGFLPENQMRVTYRGYDPDYLRLSVGTVLQWLAVESLFAEKRFRYFDFTEGESEHKRLFSTGHLDCANVALLRPTLANRMLAHSHLRFGRAVEALGKWLEAHDLKKRIRSWLRFGRGASA